MSKAFGVVSELVDTYIDDLGCEIERVSINVYSVESKNDLEHGTFLETDIAVFTEERHIWKDIFKWCDDKMDFLYQNTIEK